MNERELQVLIDEYLKRLGDALGDAPRAARQELVEDVRGHIAEAWAQSPQQDRAALLNILERLGPPEVLAQEQSESTNKTGVAERSDWLSPVAVVLTAIFWPVGIVLAWISTRWVTRDKLISTALPLLGLALVLALSFPAAQAFQAGTVVTRQVTVTGEGGPADGILAPTQTEEFNPAITVLAGAMTLFGLFGTPIVAAIYLAWRMRRPSNGRAALAPLGVTAILLTGLFVSGLPAVIHR